MYPKFKTGRWELNYSEYLRKTVAEKCIYFRVETRLRYMFQNNAKRLFDSSRRTMYANKLCCLCDIHAIVRGADHALRYLTDIFGYISTPTQ
jgi:hypothetical protein